MDQEAAARLTPDIAAILAAEEEAAQACADESIATVRAEHDRETALYGGPGPAVASVRDSSAPGPAGDVPVRLFAPFAPPEPLPLVVYMHGGGWMSGSIDSYDHVCRALANAAGALVASVGYRLAPEHPFPAALEDSLAATRALHENAAALGADPSRLAVCGDSAGGNLAAAVALRLRDRVRFQALVYPAVDALGATPSQREFATGFGLTAAGMRACWDVYLAGADPADPGVSVARADLAGAPPALVVTAACDVLRDEGEAFARALAAAGVPAAVRRFDGCIHGFWRWLAACAAGPQAVAEVGRALRGALAT